MSWSSIIVPAICALRNILSGHKRVNLTIEYNSKDHPDTYWIGSCPGRNADPPCDEFCGTTTLSSASWYPLLNEKDVSSGAGKAFRAEKSQSPGLYPMKNISSIVLSIPLALPLNIISEGRRGHASNIDERFSSLSSPSSTVSVDARPWRISLIASPLDIHWLHCRALIRTHTVLHFVRVLQIPSRAPNTVLSRGIPVHWHSSGLDFYPHDGPISQKAR